VKKSHTDPIGIDVSTAFSGSIDLQKMGTSLERTRKKKRDPTWGTQQNSQCKAIRIFDPHQRAQIMPRQETFSDGMISSTF
jgi:hypothetical protein